MSVVGGGWFGGNGSAADAMLEAMSGGASVPMPGDGVTAGPLAEIRGMGIDKVALVLGGSNSPDGSQAPGGNSTIQRAPENQSQPIQQGVVDAMGEGGFEPMKVDSGPKTTAQKIMARRKSRQGGTGDQGEDSATGPGADVARGAKDTKSGHGLIVKDPAPVPRDLVPESLAMGRETSAWTGSGPRSMAHEGRDKISSLLNFAGVAMASDGSGGLAQMAKTAAASMSRDEDAPDLAGDDVHPLKLAAFLDDALGTDWVEWEPDVVRETLTKTAGVEPSDVVMSKAMAIKIARRRPEAFFDRWRSMEKISVALNGGVPAMDVDVEEVPVEWLSNAVAIVDQLVGDADYGAEVRKYAAARLYDQGYVVAPTKLKFADADLGAKVANDGLRRKVILAYASGLKSGDVGDDVDGLTDPVTVQVSRLLRNNAYVLASLEESKEQLG